MFMDAAQLQASSSAAAVQNDVHIFLCLRLAMVLQTCTSLQMTIADRLCLYFGMQQIPVKMAHTGGFSD